jgi:L-threonate 2-dehydrogenase
MGHAIGNVLRDAGSRVITCLHGRSQRTRALADSAGIEDVPDLDAIAEQADIILSILVPREAVTSASQLSAALERTGARPIVADCNAIAPTTAKTIAAIIEAHGGRFVDAGIIGGPPVSSTKGPRVYASGPNAHDLLTLRDNGIDVRIVGDQVGQASGLKMCYASVTKGLTALAAMQQTAAMAMGLLDPLNRELEMSNPELLAWMENMVASMPPKARRWIAEMEEIATTFEGLRLPSGIMLGAAELYALVAATSLGNEIPETRLRGDTMEAVARALVDEHVLHDTSTEDSR